MNNIKPYEKYKESGIAWLGDIPEHWETEKLKHVFKIVKQISGEIGHKVLSITQNGIKVKDIESGGGQLSMDYSKYQIVQSGDFAMNHMDLLTGYVDISKFDGVTSPDYRVFKTKNSSSNKKYLLFLLQVGYKQKLFYSLGQGVSQFGRWRLPAESFNHFKFPIPPFEEQTAIANFLDYKLSKIDRFIKKKKQLIKLLNEQKAGIINDAVTKGVPGNDELGIRSYELKPSGIDGGDHRWLGDIPAHWEVRKLKYVANCFPSNIDKHSKEDEKQVRLCNYTDVYKNDYITNDMSLMLATATTDQIEKFTLLKGDVIITKDSETANDIAVPALVKEHLENVVCGYHLSVLRANDGLIGEYLFRALQCKPINIQFEVCSNGVTRVGLGVYDLKKAEIPIPPLSEQQSIVSHIETESAIINKVISTIEKEIKLVQEYRTTLIAEAVTGKIDVTNYVINDELGIMNDEDEDNYELGVMNDDDNDELGIL